MGGFCSAFMAKGFQAGFLGSPFPVQRQNSGIWALFQMHGSPASLQSNSLGSLQLLLCELAWLSLCAVAEERVGSWFRAPAGLPPGCRIRKLEAAGSLAWRPAQEEKWCQMSQSWRRPLTLSWTLKDQKGPAVKAALKGKGG